MPRSISLRNALFAAGVLGSITFGSAQALAAPDPAAGGGFCQENVCTATCIARGYHYGVCSYSSACVCHRLYE